MTALEKRQRRLDRTTAKKKKRFSPYGSSVRKHNQRALTPIMRPSSSWMISSSSATGTAAGISNSNSSFRHRSIITGDRRRGCWFSFSRAYNNDRHPVILQPTTTRILQIQVEHILNEEQQSQQQQQSQSQVWQQQPHATTVTMEGEEQNQTTTTRSSSTSCITLLQLASALLSCGSVANAYVHQIDEEDDDNHPRGRRRPSVCTTWMMHRLQKKPNIDPTIQRRYSWMNALHRLQQQPGASEKQIWNWNDAMDCLATEMEIREEVEEEHDNKNGKDADSSLRDYTHRLQNLTFNLNKEESSPRFLSPSQHKWQEILTAATSGMTIRDDDQDDDDSAAVLREQQQQEGYEEQQQQRHPALVRAEEKFVEQERRQLAYERAAELLTPLSEQEDAEIQFNMVDGDDGDVLATTIHDNSTDICLRKSFRTLGPGQWLNDEVIHFYMVLLQQRDQQLVLAAKNTAAAGSSNDGTTTTTSTLPLLRRSHFFKSFFITKLRNEGHPNLHGTYEYKNVKRWSKKVPGKDIFQLDKIFFPVNQGNQHWTLACAFMQERRIQYYDSFGGSGKEYIDDIFRYIQDEHKEKKKSDLPDAEEWELVPCDTANTPRQCNAYDCGVFTCMFTDFLSLGYDLVFGQEHVNLCRDRIASSILRGQAPLK